MRPTYSLRGLFLSAALALVLLPLVALGGGVAGLAALNWDAIQSGGHEADAASAAVTAHAVRHWAGLQAGQTADFAAGLQDLSGRYEFVLEVRALDNRVLFASPTVVDGVYHPRGFSIQPNEQAALLMQDGRAIGLLHMWIWPQGALSRLGRALLAGLWLGVATLVLLLAGVLWWIGRAILQPLRALEAATATMAAGSLDFAVPGSRVQELDALGRAFTQMRDRLQASLDRQRLLESDRRRFIAAVGHDLRTPLSSVQAFAEGLRDGLARNPEKAGRYAEVILDKAREMDRLVEDLFAYAKLDLPEAAARPESVDGAEYLGAALQGFQPAAAAKGVRLSGEGPSPFALRVDPDLFARAISNLVSNAIRHTPAGGEIVVRWAAADDGAVIRVTDTGEGIPPEDLPLLFSPLHRTDRSRSRTSGGAGLGLAITARIVALHGGSVTCDSTVGHGTTFTIHLPE